MLWKRQRLALILTPSSVHQDSNLQLLSLFRNLAVKLLYPEIWSLAAMRWTRVLITLLMVLRWALPGNVQKQIGRCR